MKVLGFENFYFLLPEDFKGGLTEALEEYLKYVKRASRKKPKDKKERPIPYTKAAASDRTHIGTVRKEDWRNFLKIIKKGYHVYGSVILTTYNEKMKKLKATSVKDLTR